MEITHITTHAENAVSHLRGMYQRPRLQALTRALVGPVQDAEDVVFSLVGARFIDNATGATLDKIAAMQNVKRLGMSDAVLRRVIHGAIAAKSTDTTLARSRRVALGLFAGTAVFIKQPDNVRVESAGRSACVAFGIGNCSLPDSALAQSLSLLQNALPAGVVLERVFAFNADGALATDGQATWVRGIGTGGLGKTLYQNSIA